VTPSLAPDPARAAARAPFWGQVVVFTGKLACLTRQQAQAKVRELGGDTADDVTHRTTMLVVGDEGFLSKIDTSRKLRTAERQIPRVQIVSETAFCRRAGLETAADLKRHLYPLREIRKRYPELREDRVRYLELCGVAGPEVRTNADRFYEFPALLVFRHAHQQLADGLPLRSVVQNLRGESAGQLALDFGRTTPARVVPFRSRSPRSGPAESAEEWFDRACELDEDPATLAEAQRAYERALELDPAYVPAVINLGNLHYAQGHLDEARGCFERAIELEPTNAKARFNLGNLLHDRGEYQAALILFRDAAALDPEFADAHFNLALTCEQLGRVEDAQRHWQRYLALDPAGEWAAIAREHLGGSAP
jgi:tetratricopeptide (TPR) repeat protein